MGFPTPDTLPTTVICRQLLIPDDPIMLGAVSGALLPLLDPVQWEQYGAVTPGDAAAAAQVMFLRYLEGAVCMIGMILAYATTTIPSNMLPCDGAQYLGTAYPQLYAVIDPVFKNSSGQFRVPDLRGRTIIGSGTGVPSLTPRVIGTRAGDEAVTLTLTQIPSHNHSEVTAVSALINGGVEAPASAAVPGAGTTGNAGGGASHPNMQPFFVLNYGIVYK